MASANVVFAKAEGGYMPVLDAAGLVSAAVASGNASAAMPAGYQLIIVETQAAPMWAAFGTAPDASVTTSRLYIPAGQRREVRAREGWKAAVLDA